jgi:hypothetical protein
MFRFCFWFLFVLSPVVYSFSPSLKGDKEGNFCLKQHMSVVVGFCAFSFCREAKKQNTPHKNARDAQYS